MQTNYTYIYYYTIFDGYRGYERLTNGKWEMTGAQMQNSERKENAQLRATSHGITYTQRMTSVR